MLLPTIQVTPASLGLVDTSGGFGGANGGTGFGLGADGDDPDFLSPAWLAALESFDAESFDGEPTSGCRTAPGQGQSSTATC